jgi:hypothetical protein
MPLLALQEMQQSAMFSGVMMVSSLTMCSQDFLLPLGASASPNWRLQ